MSYMISKNVEVDVEIEISIDEAMEVITEGTEALKDYQRKELWDFLVQNEMAFPEMDESEIAYQLHHMTNFDTEKIMTALLELNEFNDNPSDIKHLSDSDFLDYARENHCGALELHAESLTYSNDHFFSCLDQILEAGADKITLKHILMKVMEKLL